MKPLLPFLSLLLLSAVATAAPIPPKNRISEDRAKAIATQKYPGEVKSSELEFEAKHWVYSFDISGSDKKIHEVLVDAKTGKILSHKIESAAEEAKESQEPSSQR